MASTFGILEAAKSGLSVSMENLKITGHNIANVNTTGYTRQRLILSAKETDNSAYLIRPTSDNTIAQGVEVLDIQQVRSSYLDQQYRDLNADYSCSEYKSQALTYLEGLYNELDKDSGLTTSVEDFFSALNTFSSDTSSKEYRTNVQQQALSMTQNFNNVYQEMTDLWHDQNDSISTVAQEINSIADKLTQLNDSIASYERSGEAANDLRDERNLLLDDLSGLVGITYGNNEENASMIDVKIGGAALVSGTTANPIEICSDSDYAAEINAITADIASANAAITAAVSADPSADTSVLQTQLNDSITELGVYIAVSTSADATGVTDVTYHGASLVSGGASVSIEDAASGNLDAYLALNRNNLTLGGTSLSIEDGTVTGGKLYAHMEMITEDSATNSGIPYYMKQLNALAQKIAENINTIHAGGYTYPDGSDPSITGINFFDVPTVTDAGGTVTEDYTGITAGSFTISDEVMESVYNIAGSSEEVTLSGDSTETGNNTVALSLFKDLNSSGYYSDLNSIVGHLAIALNTGESILDTRQSLLNSVDAQRTSISGVSLDEETTNLIVFQQSYNACARVITAIDEMLENMIGGMGLVGR